MFYIYGVSQAGHGHIKKGVPNQDALAYKIINERAAIGVIADGVGSAAKAEEASRIAADSFIKRICDIYEKFEDLFFGESDKTRFLRDAFAYANNAIIDHAGVHDLLDYDTTLTACLLCENKLFYGHAGDSGLIALKTNGLYELVTQKAQDDLGRVYPLAMTNNWSFGEVDDVSSVLMATDGVLDFICPVFIRDSDEPLRIDILEYFMNYIEELTNGAELKAIQENVDKFIASIPSDVISDDKTALVIINADFPATRQPEEYYALRNWQKIKEEYDEAWRKKAYPDIFKS